MDSNDCGVGIENNENDSRLMTETSEKDGEVNKKLSICVKHNKVDPNLNFAFNAWTDKPKNLKLLKDDSVENVKIKDEEKRLIIKPNEPATISNGDIYTTVKTSCHAQNEKSEKCFVQLWNQEGEEWPQRKSIKICQDYYINIKKFLTILRPPYFILAMIIIVLSIHKWGGEFTQHLLVYSPRERLQVWRLLSYAVVHADIEHVALNVLLLAISGVVLELEQSTLRIGMVFWGGALLGALTAAVVQPALYLMGASAGVYALLTSHLSNVCLNWDSLSLRWYRIFAVCVLSGSDAGAAAARRGAGAGGHPTGWAAHAAGALAGMTIAFLCYKGTRRHTVFNKVATVISILILIVVVVTTITINVLMDDPMKHR